MPTLKNKPATKTAKPAPKADTKEKEAQSAERTKLIESLAPELSPLMVSEKEAYAAVKDSFFDTVDKLKELGEENELTDKERRQLVILALAEANDMEADDINSKNPKAISLYTSISRYLNAAFPKDKKVAHEIDKAREKGVSLNDFHAVARGKIKASEVNKSLGKGGDTKAKAAEKAKRNAIDNEEAAGNELTAFAKRCLAADVEVETIQEWIQNWMVEFLASMGDFGE